MRLLSLSIDNFGIYGGKHWVDLTTDARPIVLFGGKNGAGKTTLLEAIRLCLYGPRVLGERVARGEYEEYLGLRIHSGNSQSTSEASLALAFEYSHAGERHKYEVVRSWVVETNTVQERFMIFEDGRIFPHLNEDRWQDFIFDLIPPKVSELFFFDGEKIQSLAQDSKDSETLDYSIKGLLGLDIVEKLQTDLSFYMRRARKTAASSDLTAVVHKAEQKKAALRDRYNSLLQERARTQSHVDYLAGKIDDLEREIAQESKGFALKREELKAESNRLEGELEAIRREMQSMAGDLLPFALVPNLCRQLQTQLEQESKFEQWQATQRWLEPKLRTIELSLKSGELLQRLNGTLSENERIILATTLLDELSGLTCLPEDLNNIELIHRLSEREYIQITGWIRQATTEVPARLRVLTERLDDLTRRWQDVYTALRQIPRDEVLSPLLQQLNQYQRELELVKREGLELDSQLTTADIQLQEANRELEKAYLQLRASERLEQRLVLVERTLAALDSYLQLLTVRKIDALQHLATKRFNQLVRKEGFIKEIIIDPTTFSVTISDHSGRAIPKAQLSAGEKQIFAIATLWALRELSGRPLPVIIDTPLGRLDSDHRNNLVTKYFPHASHQVVILSTDTEIDQAFFQELKPYLAHTYSLEYDSNTGSSSVQEGYFWKEAANGAQ